MSSAIRLTADDGRCVFPRDIERLDCPSAPARAVPADGFEAARPSLIAVPFRSPLAAAAAKPRERDYQRALEAYTTAHDAWESRLAKPYWARVDNARAGRKDIPWNRLGQGPYVDASPPIYDGPPKPTRADYGLDPEPTRPPREIATFVNAARAKGYRFDLAPANATPEQAAAFETQFRRAYVKAALAAGFNREQVVGVYVFETGGDGHHTELHPASAAIGYAQLIIANSVTTIAESGPAIAGRMRALGLNAKADLVLKLRRDILAAYGGHVPTWGEAQSTTGTQLSQAVHAVNLDIDIGPQLQITKLLETAQLYRTYSQRNGTPNRELTAEILEAMNLAGPSSGYALGHPATGEKLTVNFFQRSGYEGNPVLSEVGPDGKRRARTAASLMTRMSEIMHGPRRELAGSREIASIFDELAPTPRPAP